MKFAIIGVGGYIAQRHLEAIKDLGHELVVAYDRNDSVGIMDRYFPNSQFFTDFERFESFIDSVKGTDKQVDYVAICTPNHMHSSHIKFALSHGANAICEKPLVLHEKEIDELLAYENKYGKRVYTVLQLRVHESILNLKKKIDLEGGNNYSIKLSYITSRGQWYHESWKGDVRKSGGLSTNIGVHFFDMLTWIFGKMKHIEVAQKTNLLEKGHLVLEKASVDWFLTVDKNLLPKDAVENNKTTYRSIEIDGQEFEFSEGFTELHKLVYSDILNGRGYGLNEAREAIHIVEKIRGMNGIL